jgi:hypothetical protein
MNIEKLTAELLNELFVYFPETGKLVARHTMGTGRAYHKVGEEVGTLNPNGYRQVTIGRRKNSTHRLIWFLVTGKWPDHEIDHLNGVKDDNRWDNLRDITHRENVCNKRMYSNNESGCTGVSWHKGDNRWQASIRQNGKLRYIGCFDSLEEAIKARQQAQEETGIFTERHGKSKTI